jgi:Zn-dependent protease with chaperone function
MSKKMGVHLERVCVVPFGRGRLTNAFGGKTQIAVSDDYGHWLHGSELDFVVGHELAHAKHQHALKSVIMMGGMFAVLSAATFVMPQLPVTWRIVLSFGAILLPLTVFYALSRRHEYLADRLAVEATGEPEKGIHALINLYRRAEVPAERSSFLEWFSTHPSLWHRINAIAQFGGVPTEYLTEVQLSFKESAAADAER